MTRRCACLAVALCVAATVAGAAEIAAFSRMDPGAVMGGWRLQTIRGRAAAEFRIVNADAAVLEALSSDAVGSLIHDVGVGARAARKLSWRWRVDAAVAGSDIYKKSGDDFPARVYALFDYDAGRLPFGASRRPPEGPRA